MQGASPPVFVRKCTHKPLLDRANRFPTCRPATTLSYLTATVLDKPQRSTLTFTVKSSCQMETLPIPSSALRGILEISSAGHLLWNLRPSGGVAAAELGI